MGNAGQLKDHIIICGWSKKGEEVLRELHGDDVQEKPSVVILADLETSPATGDQITFFPDVPTLPGYERHCLMSQPRD
jgi:hypothetical protein